MTEKIVLLGAGALAREYISIYGKERFAVSYVDPAYQGSGTHVNGVEIDSDWTRMLTKASHYVLAVADQPARHAMQQRARASGLVPCQPLIHPGAYVAPTATVGRGAIVTCFVALGDLVEIGEDVLLMHQISVGHDCRVGELSVLCPGVTLGGGTNLGRNCFIGGNAVTAPGINIGDEAVISAGAACLSDVPAGGFAIGSPARRVAKRG